MFLEVPEASFARSIVIKNFMDTVLLFKCWSHRFSHLQLKVRALIKVPSQIIRNSVISSIFLDDFHVLDFIWSRALSRYRH